MYFNAIPFLRWPIIPNTTLRHPIFNVGPYRCRDMYGTMCMKLTTNRHLKYSAKITPMSISDMDRSDVINQLANPTLPSSIRFTFNSGGINADKGIRTYTGIARMLKRVSESNLFILCQGTAVRIATAFLPVAFT